MTRTAPDPLATNNERVKLFANFVSAVGLGLIGFAILRPLTESLANADLSTLLWGPSDSLMHGFLPYSPTLIRKEAKQ